MSNSIQLAVVGATGLVGQAVLELLAQRQLPVGRVFAVDAADKEGETAAYGNLELDVHPIDGFAFENVALAIFAAGSELAREYAPLARAAGAAVVDFSSAFREDDSVPLVIPAINGALLADAGEAALASAPNCTVTPLALALAALRPLGLQRVSVATYQSVSGSGQAAMEELADQTTALFSQRETESRVYDKRIAFNVLPQIGALDADGASEEERSVERELTRLLDLPQLQVEATCVRVPVFFGHAWAVNAAFEHEFDMEQARKRLLAAGLQVVAADKLGGYVTPMEATGNEAVWVSRLRGKGRTLSFWLAADNVKAGAALNCVNIAETLLKQNGLI